METTPAKKGGRSSRYNGAGRMSVIKRDGLLLCIAVLLIFIVAGIALGIAGFALSLSTRDDLSVHRYGLIMSNENLFEAGGGSPTGRDLEPCRSISTGNASGLTSSRLATLGRLPRCMSGVTTIVRSACSRRGGIRTLAWLNIDVALSNTSNTTTATADGPRAAMTNSLIPSERIISTG